MRACPKDSRAPCERYGLNTLEAMKSGPKAYAYGLIAQDEITPEKLDPT